MGVDGAEHVFETGGDLFSNCVDVGRGNGRGFDRGRRLLGGSWRVNTLAMNVEYRGQTTCIDRPLW